MDIPAHYRNKGDLTRGSIPAHILRLGLPMAWGILAIISVQLVDTYFISLLGTEELAGFSFTFPVTLIVSHIVFGVNIAVSSVVARLIGEGKMEDVRRIAQHGIAMAVALSAVIGLVTYLLMEPLFRLLGAGEESMPTILAYMPLWLLANVVVSLHSAGNSVIRSAGSALFPAMTMTLMAALNLVLTPVFVFGHLGAPSMGVEGAALATLIANILAGLAGFYVLAFHKKLMGLGSLYKDKVKDSMKRMLVIAIPAGIGNIIQPLTGAVVLAVIAGHGQEAVAAFGVASRVEAFTLIALLGLALGMGPIIGQNWGARNDDRVRETIKVAIQFNMAWSLFVAICLAAFAQPIAGAFSDNPEVMSITVLFFYIVPLTFGMGNLVNGWASAFNAMGMPKRAFAMIVITAFALKIPAVFIGNALGGIPGILIGLAISNVIAGLYFHVTSKKYCFR